MAHTKRTITVEYLTEDSPFTQSDYLYYVGIDPSYSSTGLVILDGIHNIPLVNCHIKAGNPKDPFYVRIRKLLDVLSDNLLHFNTDDIYVVMEGAAFASEFNAFKLGKLSGVIEYFLGEHKIAYSLVAPTFAKKVATGKGSADKLAVMQGVRNKWGFRSNCDDENDAYVMAQIARGARPETPIKKRRQSKNVKSST